LVFAFWLFEVNLFPNRSQKQIYATK